MKRARHIHQKVERRKNILATALGLLEELPFQDITMTQVAERTGLVKGTLYLYFATKEELFLELLRDQFHGWFWDLEAGLESLPRRGRLEAAARLLADTTAARHTFRRLLGILHGVLEQNLPEESALAFRRELLARSLAMGALLERHLAFLAPGQGFRLLLQSQALTIGLQAMTEPSDTLRQVLDHPDLAPLKLDFGQAFLEGILDSMIGLKTENKRSRHRTAGAQQDPSDSEAQS